MSYSEDIFERMMPPNKRPQTQKATPEEEDASAVHDAIVLETVKSLERVAYVLGDILGIINPLNYDDILGFRLEHEIPSAEAFDYFADIAMTRNGQPTALLEIKSQREPQSASQWYRQVRKYSKFTGLPAALVVQHDLAPWLSEYLALAKVTVIDLRRLPEDLSWRYSAGPR
jgi:hypothetical protein